MPAASRSARALAWCYPLLLLGAAGAAAALVRGLPTWFAGALLIALCGGALCWVVASALWPARADRCCPGCGALQLVRVDARSARGLRCTACGWSDHEASAWMHAEEEGALEPIVLAERAHRPTLVRAPASVDHGAR